MIYELNVTLTGYLNMFEFLYTVSKLFKSKLDRFEEMFK